MQSNAEPSRAEPRREGGTFTRGPTGEHEIVQDSTGQNNVVQGRTIQYRAVQDWTGCLRTLILILIIRTQHQHNNNINDFTSFLISPLSPTRTTDYGLLSYRALLLHSIFSYPSTALHHGNILALHCTATCSRGLFERVKTYCPVLLCSVPSSPVFTYMAQTETLNPLCFFYSIL